MLIPLWDRPAPLSAAGETFEPMLEIFPAASPTRRGALICPGGGYYLRAEHEGAPVARAFNAAGYHAFVLHYRVAPNRYPSSLLDAQRAIGRIRSQSPRWHCPVEHLCLLGFSAGGHLAACAAILAPPRPDLDDLAHHFARPQALLLAYPVISSGPAGHPDSLANLLGPNPAPETLARLSLETQVHPLVPPTFLWHTADDEVVSVTNSLLLTAALAAQSVEVQLQIYPHGPHGLGLAEGLNAGRWWDSALHWLESLPGPPPGLFSTPPPPPHA